MKKLLILLACVFLIPSKAQLPSPILVKLWDGNSSYPVVVPTKDNCALLIGGFDHWVTSSVYVPNHIMKLDSMGNIMYSKEQVLISPASTNMFTEYYDASLCEASNFVVVGALGTKNGGNPSTYTACCIKYDGSANPIWYKTINEPNLKSVKPNAVSVCRDSGFVFCGTAVDNSNLRHAFIARFDKNGNMDWFKWMSLTTISGNDAASVKQTQDSGYVMIGSSYSSTQNGTVLWKFDKTGNLQWCKRFCSGNTCSTGLDVVELGNHYFCLSADAGNLFFKCDLTGNLIWSRNQGIFGNRMSHLENGRFLFSKGAMTASVADTAGNGQWSILTGYENTACRLKSKSYMLVVDCMNGQGNALFLNAVVILDSNATNTSTCIYKSNVSATSATMSVNSITCTLQSGGTLSTNQAIVNSKPVFFDIGCMYEQGTGISSQTVHAGIKIFPNPSHEYIEVGPVANGYFELTSLLGQSLLVQHLHQEKPTRISMLSIADGTYGYRITSGGRTAKAGKLIILHSAH